MGGSMSTRDIAAMTSRTDRESVDAAVRDLIEKEYQPLVSGIYRLVCDRPSAEDIVSEAIARTWQGVAAGNVVPPFRPWTWAVARNLARDWTRADNRLRTAREELEQLAAAAPKTEMAAVVIRSLEVRAAIGQLNARLKAIALLVLWEGYSYAEAGNLLGFTHSSVRCGLGLARRRLADLLCEECDSFEPYESLEPVVG